MTVVLALGAHSSGRQRHRAVASVLRAVAERSRGNVAGYQIGEVQTGATPDVNRYVYLLKLAAVQIRAVDSDALVLQGGIPASEVDWQGRVFAAGAGPYIDGIALDGPPADEDEPFRSAVDRMVALVGREKPSATMLLGPIRLPASPAAATALDGCRASIAGHAHPGHRLRRGPAALGAALAAAARLTDLIAGDLVTLDERTTDLRILQGTSNVTAAVAHRLVYSLNAFETFLVYWGPPDGAPLEVEIAVANVDDADGARSVDGRVSGAGARAEGPTGQPPADGASGGRPSADRRFQLRQRRQPRHERRCADGRAAAGRGDRLSSSAGAGRAGRRSCATTSRTSASNSTSIRRRPIRPTTS